MKRVFDISLSLFLLVILSPVLFLIGLAVRISSSGPILHWGMRIGRHNKRFKMPKFRSMHLNTPSVATELLREPKSWLTPIGSFLRKTSLDELPQLWSILIGDMTFVGPRPALFSQYDLIERRTKFGVHLLLPGLTGLAQIEGRDQISLDEKISLDIEYLNRRSFLFDLYILSKTFLKIWNTETVSH